MGEVTFTPTRRVFDPIIYRGGKGQRQVRLKHYAVQIDGAEPIGWVGQRLERQEKSIPGERIIASSWEAPRWYYEKVGQPGKRYGGYTTRGAAVEGLQQDMRVR